MKRDALARRNVARGRSADFEVWLPESHARSGAAGKQIDTLSGGRTSISSVATERHISLMSLTRLNRVC